jgi:2-dehydropantoate 2-reductase
MKTITVVGIGAIGSLVGGRLALAGEDVTLICTSWRENAEHMKRHGLTVIAPDGGERTTAVSTLFIDELALFPAKIELLFVATKSNDTGRCLTALESHLADDCVVVSLQNGMNEDAIIPIVGVERVVAGVSYTGGMLVQPGCVRTHGVRSVVGRLDGRVTPRISQVARILDLVAPTEVSRDIMRQRWDKLAQVTTTVPVGAVTGVGFPAILQIDEAHPMLARLMSETLAVAAAAGYPLDGVTGLSRADWLRLARGPAPDLSRIIRAPFELPPGAPAPNPDEAPLLKDIKSGLPLEIEYTNGYVIQKGDELGVPTPAHDLVVGLIKGMAGREIEPGPERLRELLEKTSAR